MRNPLYVALIALLFLTPSAIHAETLFPDLSDGHWAKDEIDFLFNQKVIKGHDDGTFQPREAVTRAQAAMMIVNALQLDTENRTDPHFTDVTTDFYAYDAIATVADEGIMLGDGNSFSPNTPMPRAQMAAVIDRAFELEEATGQMKFKDVDRLNLFYDNIQNLASNHITTGYPDRTFLPKKATTRAEFSVFVARALDEMFKPEALSEPTLDVLKKRITEAEREIEKRMYQEWEKAFYSDQALASFDTIEPAFKKFYTDQMIESVWKPFYYDELSSWGPALAQYFHFDLLEEVQLHILGQNHVVLTGTAPPTELQSYESYFEFTLVYENNKWLIDDVSGNY